MGGGLYDREDHPPRATNTLSSSCYMPQRQRHDNENTHDFVLADPYRGTTRVIDSVLGLALIHAGLTQSRVREQCKSEQDLHGNQTDVNTLK